MLKLWWFFLVLLLLLFVVVVDSSFVIDCNGCFHRIAAPPRTTRRLFFYFFGFQKNTVCYSKEENKNKKQQQQQEEESGGKQYIHNENKVRQEIINELFWPTSLNAFEKSQIFKKFKESSVKRNNDNNNTQPFRILEIGCGSGATTTSLAQACNNYYLLNNNDKNNNKKCTIEIVGVDANPEMIKVAKERYKSSLQNNNCKSCCLVTFHCSTGESFANNNENMLKKNNNVKLFDAVWLRFVVVHVPDPIKLLQAAKDCLKPGGTLLIEDTSFDGYFSQPHLPVISFYHDNRIQASLKLGADMNRGDYIGSYMKELELSNINCNSFIPLHGKGQVTVEPWCANQNNNNNNQHQKSCYTQNENADLALQLMKMSLDSSMDNFLEMNLCTRQDIEQAHEELDAVFSSDYQLFTMPGGRMYQWWGTKKKRHKPIEREKNKIFDSKHLITVRAIGNSCNFEMSK